MATAYVGGTPRKIKNGVIKKPPPTPNNPDNIPTIPLKENIANTFTETSAIGRKTSIFFIPYSIVMFINNYSSKLLLSINRLS